MVVVATLIIICLNLNGFDLDLRHLALPVSLLSFRCVGVSSQGYGEGKMFSHDFVLICGFIRAYLFVIAGLNSLLLLSCMDCYFLEEFSFALRCIFARWCRCVLIGVASMLFYG